MKLWMILSIAGAVTAAASALFIKYRQLAKENHELFNFEDGFFKIPDEEVQ